MVTVENNDKRSLKHKAETQVWTEFLMYKRLNILLLSVFALVLVACGGDSSQSGDTSLRKNLRMTNITVDHEGLDRAFDSDVTGPYSLTVDNDVENFSFTLGNLFEESGVEIFVFRQVVPTAAEPVAIVNDAIVGEGASLSIPIVDGDNLIVVRVRTEDREQNFDYNFVVHRLSNSADLTDVQFGNINSNTGVILPLEGIEYVSPAEFSADVMEYTLEAPYTSCTVKVWSRPASDESTMRLSGEVGNNGRTIEDFAISNRSLHDIDLAVGTNTFQIDVESEDGLETKTYSFTIVRAGPTTEEAEADNDLANLSVSPGDIQWSALSSTGFNCEASDYSLRVNNNDETVSLTATPTVEGRTIKVAKEVTTQEATAQTAAVTELQDIVLAEAGMPLELPVDLGLNVFVVSLADNDDGDPVVHYRVNVTRDTSNRVIVETGAELQAALQNAAVNQEIFIASPEILRGDATLAASGKEGVAFYSEVSGTEDEPILLTGLTLTGLAPTEGTEAATVLELTGDHWVVQNVVLTDAEKGLVLNGSDNNFIRGVAVSDVSGDAITVLNGSDSNIFSFATFNNVGGDGVVVGTDASQWDTAPTPGPYEPANNSNTFVDLSSSGDVGGALIRINEGAQGTRILDAQLSADSLDVDAPIVIRGNETEFSYSSVELDSSVSVTSLISVSDSDADWLSDQWGEDSLIYDNRFDFAGAATAPVVSADASVDRVSVDDNIRIDGADVVYSGGAINESYASPTYQIQWVDPDDEVHCLSRGNIAYTVTSTDRRISPIAGEFDGLYAVACDSSNTGQHWDFINDAAGLMQIASAVDGAIIAPRFQGSMVVGGADILSLFSAEEYAEDSAQYLRWSFNTFSDGGLYFSNSFSPSHAFIVQQVGGIRYSAVSEINTLVLGQFAADTEERLVAYITPFNNSATQRFTLVPVE